MKTNIPPEDWTRWVAAANLLTRIGPWTATSDALSPDHPWTDVWGGDGDCVALIGDAWAGDVVPSPVVADALLTVLEALPRLLAMVRSLPEGPHE
jgi:hypothetical protein